MATEPVRLRVLKAMTECLKDITPANGYHTDLKGQVFRGRVIFGDNDESYTGQASSFVLARKLKNKGFSVSVRIPETVGTDWADL